MADNLSHGERSYSLPFTKLLFVNDDVPKLLRSTDDDVFGVGAGAAEASGDDDTHSEASNGADKLEAELPLRRFSSP